MAAFKANSYPITQTEYRVQLHEDKPRLNLLALQPKYRQDSPLKLKPFTAPVRNVRRPLKAHALSQAQIGVEASFTDMKHHSPQSANRISVTTLEQVSPERQASSHHIKRISSVDQIKSSHDVTAPFSDAAEEHIKQENSRDLFHMTEKNQASEADVMNPSFSRGSL